jgi:hypothetical protein
MVLQGGGEVENGLADGFIICFVYEIKSFMVFYLFSKHQFIFAFL